MDDENDSQGHQLTEKQEEGLEKLIKKHDVMLFMKGDRNFPECGFSRQMVNILNTVRVEYETFNILKDKEVKRNLQILSNWPTFPQLYVKGELVGGFDLVKQLLDSGKLMKYFSPDYDPYDLTVVEYETFDILEDEEVRQNLKIFSKWPTYPQLYVKGELVGGLDIVNQLLQSGDLMKHLCPD